MWGNMSIMMKSKSDVRKYSDKMIQNKNNNWFNASAG